MAHLEGFDFGITVVEEIPIDEDAEAREYMIKMYERIKRLETPTPDTILREIVETTSSSGSSSSMTYSDDSLQEKIPTSLEVKKLVEVKVDDKTYLAPIFHNVDQLREWNRILNHHEWRIEEIVTKLRVLKMDQRSTQRIQEVQVETERYSGFIQIRFNA